MHTYRADVTASFIQGDVRFTATTQAADLAEAESNLIRDGYEVHSVWAVEVAQ